MRFLKQPLQVLLFNLVALSLTFHSPLPDSNNRTVSPALFVELEEFARIVDITYCVTVGGAGIIKPFTCLSRCADFPAFELVKTWNTGPLLSDGCGFIALDHAKERIIAAFRGTYSVANTVVDLSTIPQKYVPYPDGEDNDGPRQVLGDARPPFQHEGCFSSAGSLQEQGHYEYESKSHCQVLCAKRGSNTVFALSEGNQCWCGDELPAARSQVSHAKCDLPCAGFRYDKCGGDGYWAVHRVKDAIVKNPVNSDSLERKSEMERRREEEKEKHGGKDAQQEEQKKRPGGSGVALRKTRKYEGCYSSSGSLRDQGQYVFQSVGWCRSTCEKNSNNTVFALSDGDHCWCGDDLPPASSEVDDENCDTPCGGYALDMCGGNGYWSVHTLQDASAESTTAAEECKDCTVHMGFYSAWQQTRGEILRTVSQQHYFHPNYKIHLVGHSLGGAVAALAALELQGSGYGPTVTTFGEPRIGNDKLAAYLDARFHLTVNASGAKGDGAAQKYRRVTHVDDPVPLLPLSDWGYAMHAGEIFISKPDLSPDVGDLLLCEGSSDPGCIAGQDAASKNEDSPRGDLLASVKDELDDVSNEPWGIPSKYKLWQLFFAHRDYFWRLGLCVPGGDPLGGGRGNYEGAMEQPKVEL